MSFMNYCQVLIPIKVLPVLVQLHYQTNSHTQISWCMKDFICVKTKKHIMCKEMDFQMCKGLPSVTVKICVYTHTCTHSHTHVL